MTPRSTGVVVIVCVLVGASFFGVTLVWAQSTPYEAPFSGQPLRQLLQPSVTLSCRSDLADSTGYYPKGGGHALKSGLARQSQPASWRILLTGEEDARVLAGQETTPEKFQVIRRDAASVILVRVGQGLAGGTIEVLTVDPQNGSFVASDSSVGPLWNRTTVWVGRCQ